MAGVEMLGWFMGIIGFLTIHGDQAVSVLVLIAGTGMFLFFTFKTLRKRFCG